MFPWEPREIISHLTSFFLTNMRVSEIPGFRIVIYPQKNLSFSRSKSWVLITNGHISKLRAIWSERKHAHAIFPETSRKVSTEFPAESGLDTKGS